MDAFQDRCAEKAKVRDRRNQLDRAKAKAYRTAQAVCFSSPYGCGGWEEVDRCRAQYVRYHYRNRTLRCESGRMAGNPHRWWKGEYALTRQELQADLRFEDMIEEL